MLTLDTNTAKINKIGAATATKLQRLEIKTAKDLLEYYPFRYEDYGQTVAIRNLTPGITANVRGAIEFIQNKRSFRKRMIITEALINDDSGQLKVIWFNQPFIGRNLKVGDQVSLAGTTQGGFLGLEMVAPEYEKIGLGKLAHTTGLVPIYHVTANLTNKQLRFLIKSIIGAASQFDDVLPEAIKRKYQLLDLAKALSNIHFPRSAEMLARARRRLQFEELFLAQLRAQVEKLKVKSQKSEVIKFFPDETNKFVKQLPFQLTGAQKKAGWEIIKDLGKDKPMSRLLEGDVGSGKTVTAALAMLNVALNKKQSALLVPTEILAAQHFETLVKLFKGAGVKVGLLTRSQHKILSVIARIPELLGETKQSRENREHHGIATPRNAAGLAMTRKEMLGAVKDGKIDIIVGTHALLQEDVEFRDLALAVIDEQHRFGVEQRRALRKKSGLPSSLPSTRDRDYGPLRRSFSEANEASRQNLEPHLLSMTATPIPRSLAQVIYGDLDLSIINELPAGRKKIATWLVPEFKRQGAYDFIKREILAGRQAFVICPLISPSDKLGVKSVAEEFKKLNERVFPEIKMAYLHGRMPAHGVSRGVSHRSGSAHSHSEMSGKAISKDEVMQKFLNKEIKILVATSVVEVGVDVPNASVMMIEGAERFGLAQLHQFRGRVGRSAHQSYCLLFTESLNEQTRERLTVFTKSNDGFKLAEADLKQRGPGEVYGTAQKGFPEFKIATLNDYQLIKETKDAAEQVVVDGIEKYPKLSERIEKTGEYVVG